jgi:hypothetical protein
MKKIERPLRPAYCNHDARLRRSCRFQEIDARPDEGCDLNGRVTNKLTSRDMTQVQIEPTFLY